MRSGNAAAAAEDFERARRRGAVRRAAASLANRERALVPYEEVRTHLRAVESAERHLEDIPLDAIVGSVGRYNDFTREFLPRRAAGRDRWVGVKLAMTGLEGVPPIEVYRVGDAYFVRDGNHRVSVARELGAPTIQGYVTPVHVRVPYGPDDDPETLIRKAGQTSFLERTRLDEVRPDSDVAATEAGAYAKLLEHVSVHRYYMGIDEDREVAWDEAVVHWYDVVYLPVVQEIRASGILAAFPGRTETDLYLWLADHRAHLQDRLGWDLPSEQVVQGLAGSPLEAPSDRDAWLGRWAEEVGGRDAAAPEAASPEVADTERPPTRSRLADDLLVAFDLGDPGLTALRQTMVLAQKERARIYGLRVLRGGEGDDERAATDATFRTAVEGAGLDGQLAFEVGDPVGRIVDRAPWADMVVCNVAYPGEPGEPATLARNLRPLLRRSPRPLLATSGRVSPLQHPLLAYDGGPRAEAALAAVIYMALAWGADPVVVSVAERDGVAEEALDDARARMERFGVDATYVAANGAVPDALIATAEAHDRDVLVLGSYSNRRFLQDLFGGLLEALLRRTRTPLLIA